MTISFGAAVSFFDSDENSFESVQGDCTDPLSASSDLSGTSSSPLNNQNPEFVESHKFVCIENFHHSSYAFPIGKISFKSEGFVAKQDEDMAINSLKNNVSETDSEINLNDLVIFSPNMEEIHNIRSCKTDTTIEALKNGNFAQKIIDASGKVILNFASPEKRKLFQDKIDSGKDIIHHTATGKEVLKKDNIIIGSMRTDDLIRFFVLINSYFTNFKKLIKKDQGKKPEFPVILNNSTQIDNIIIIKLYILNSLIARDVINNELNKESLKKHIFKELKNLEDKIVLDRSKEKRNAQELNEIISKDSKVKKEENDKSETQSKALKLNLVKEVFDKVKVYLQFEIVIKPFENKFQKIEIIDHTKDTKGTNTAKHL